MFLHPVVLSDVYCEIQIFSAILTLHTLCLLQRVPTIRAVNVKFFQMASEWYIVFVNNFDGVHHEQDSVILKFDPKRSKFVQFQTLTASAGHGVGMSIPYALAPPFFFSLFFFSMLQISPFVC